MLRATILSSAPLPLPSASGIELVGDTAFVVSDDAPFLYRFQAADLAPGEPIKLFETAHFSSGRIPKTLKPDLEAMAFLPATATQSAGLLVVGSGATAARESGFWVDIDAENRPGAVYPVSLSRFYRALRAEIPTGQLLNIEALATTTTDLLLFQRPLGTTAGRHCFRLPLADARALLRPSAAAAPPFRTAAYTVPDLGGSPGGLSGATVFEACLFVSASVEKAHDAVVDGEVLGSFVGLLDPAKPAQGQFAQLTWPDQRPFREKVEGVAVRRKTAHGYELLLVTDDDKGGSTVLVVEVVVG